MTDLVITSLGFLACYSLAVFGMYCYAYGYHSNYRKNGPGQPVIRWRKRHLLIRPTVGFAKA